MSSKTSTSCDEQVLAARLKQSALLAKVNAQNDTERLYAEVLRHAAGVDGRGIRVWMIELERQQAAELDWEVLSQQNLQSGAWQIDDLDSQQKMWESRVIHDGAGKAVVVVPGDYIEQLAYWVAKCAKQPEWVRRKSEDRAAYTAEVVASIQRLVELLQAPGSPQWPPLIELFEDANRPVHAPEAMSSKHFGSLVRNRLSKQRIEGALHRLAEVVNAQRRLADLQSPPIPRPNMLARLQRQFAKDVAWWFQHRCRREGSQVNLLIADLINWASPDEEVHERQIAEWLRPERERRRGKARKARPSA